MMHFRDNLHKCQEYVRALEEERKKIQVFQRELPLCLELVSQAIEACKQQLCGTTTNTTTTTECCNGHSEYSEQTTSDGPILEEFMPLKTSISSYNDDDELESNKPQINTNNNNEKSGKKSDWLRSVQLWNQTPDPLTIQEDHPPKKVTVVEVKRTGNGGAFHPFQKENSKNGDVKNNNQDNCNDNNSKENNDNNKNKPVPTPAASACSSAHDTDMTPSGASGASGGGGGGGGASGGGGNGSKKVDKDGQSQRKARRCWSPELHRRFVHALQQLGGSHVATPKQIRELMKVDGLTNDEVKSHLQKYRLHTRRPSSTVHNNGNQQTPQFVVVGGIWVPPPEYNTSETTTTATTTTTVCPPSGIYAPIATVGTPPSLHQRHKPKQSSQSHSEGGVHSNSPATSSSTHTSTGSHAH